MTRVPDLAVYMFFSCGVVLIIMAVGMLCVNITVAKNELEEAKLDTDMYRQQSEYLAKKLKEAIR